MSGVLRGRAAGWRPALRMAWRDARRAKGRTALVLVMIALPVLAVTAADVFRATQDIAGTEALERRIGAGDARVDVRGNEGRVIQAPDPADNQMWTGEGVDRPATADDVRRVLGDDARLLALRTGSTLSFETDAGLGDAEVTEVDLRDPLATGLFELTAGELPSASDEVVVNAALVERGPDIGEELVLDGGARLRIVGTAESTSYTGFPMVVGLPGVSGVQRYDQGRSWLVEVTGGVSWEQVRELNTLGASVVSRVVLEDPPPLPPEIVGLDSGVDEAVVAAAVLVVTMALLEVVLLAGPAFAVSARRQSRTLALLAATGGTPRQARRVVLAGGLVLGLLAAAMGVVLGLAVGWALLPVLQQFSGSRFGPYDVPWPHLAAVAAFGVASAFLAAVVPAWLASRQDVVAVLAGRRGDRRPSLRSPMLGLVLLGAGVAGAAYGAGLSSSGEFFIAAAAIVTVLGMVLLVPVVVVAVARLSRRLPLSLRYAVRDAARHRTRTVPAVAAVAATVAGVVALGIATSSDAAQTEALYDPQLPMGQGIVRGFVAGGDLGPVADAVRRELPDADVQVLRGLREDDGEGGYTFLDFRAAGRGPLLSYGYGSTYGSSVLVGREVPDVVIGMSATEEARSATALRAGRAVVFTDQPRRVAGVDEVTVVVDEGDMDAAHSTTRRVRLPATFVAVPTAWFGSASAVVPPAVAQRLDVPVVDVSVHVSGADLDEALEADVDEATAAVASGTDFYVERGYRSDEEAVIIQLVLAGLGAVLMLGGTLTATFLALSDARPDLATLAAVGAGPRRRRAVAAAYALVVGGVGALLGAVVGFVPGVAVSFPLTRGYVGDTAPESHYLAVPWLMIGGLVVVLPLLVAAVVWVSARSRLPLAARLE